MAIRRLMDLATRHHIYNQTVHIATSRRNTVDLQAVFKDNRRLGILDMLFPIRQLHRPS